RRRADLDHVSLRSAPVGDPGRAQRVRAVPRRLQRQRDDARGEGQADPVAQPRRGRPGLALRQRTLRAPAPRRRGPAPRPAAARAQRAGAKGAFYLPETANARGVCDAWAAAADGEPDNPDPIALLIVSGDEAAANPAVRGLAEQAERVLVISMFHGLAAGWADLVLPGTSYLERDGTYVNLEGRIQRLRRAVIPPTPDELAWIARLAERFGVEVSPYPSAVFE